MYIYTCCALSKTQIGAKSDEEITMVPVCVILSLGLWTLTNGPGRAPVTTHTRAFGLVVDFVLCNRLKCCLRTLGASLVLPAWVLLGIDALSFAFHKTLGIVNAAPVGAAGPPLPMSTLAVFRLRFAGFNESQR